jgi:hypothetical protein
MFKKRKQTSNIFVFYEEFEHDANADDIDALHRSRGGLCNGFHYVIRKDGKVEQGRDELEHGWHTPGRNADTLAVCYIVDPGGEPNDQQVGSEVLRTLSVKYPHAEVIYPHQR